MIGHCHKVNKYEIEEMSGIKDQRSWAGQQETWEELVRPEFVSMNSVWKIKLQMFPDK